MDFHLLTVYSIPLDISTCTVYHMILVHVHIQLDNTTCTYISLDISTCTYTT